MGARFVHPVLAGLFALALSAFGCAGRPAARPEDGRPFLLTGVTLVTMGGTAVVTDGALLVVADEIRYAGPRATAPPAADATRVDGGGAWVVPGLIDMHVHLESSDELDLHLLYGVTTVANLHGEPRHLEWREEVRAGRRRGPTIYTSGRTIDGDPPRTNRFVSLGDPARAAEVVDEQARAGYDFIKVYDLLQPEAYRAIVEAARAHDLAVVGHVPKAVGLEQSLTGHDLIAHGEEYFYTFFANRVDPERLPEAARLTAEAGVAVCPNTGMIRVILDQAHDIDAVLARPEIRYLPPERRIEWMPENNRYVGRPAEWIERNERMYPFLLRLTGALHEAGVPLVVGTDASTPGAVPGLATHRELEDLVAAGLTPLEALRAATATPGDWIARHLHERTPPGVLAAGRRADLLLLARDPRADLTALREIRAVVAAGRWYDAAEIAEDVAARVSGYEAALAPYLRFKALLEAGDITGATAVLERPDAAILDETTLNSLGYAFLYRRDDPRTAVAVFRVNVERHPDSGNVWDSLGEGQRALGDIEAAIASYRRSLELEPDNRNAVEQIREMESGVSAPRPQQ